MNSMQTQVIDVRAIAEREVERAVINHSLDWRRPCVVKAKKSGPREGRVDRKAFCHSIYLSTTGPGQMLALVEFEDGHMEQVQPKNIIFVDGGGFDGWFDAREAKKPESLGKSSEETPST